jgi:hypothetical protein
VPQWANVRFNPDENNAGEAKLYFHAWDESQGVAGSDSTPSARAAALTA